MYTSTSFIPRIIRWLSSAAEKGIGDYIEIERKHIEKVVKEMANKVWVDKSGNSMLSMGFTGARSNRKKVSSAT